jgi:Tfp pilus assembly protein PilN
MVDFNKEIKLSDLFRRSPKEQGEDTPATEGETAAEPKAERTSLFKREISFGRKKSADGEPENERKPKRGRRERKPKEPKEPKAPKEKRARGKAKPGATLPQVPLMRAFDLMPSGADQEATGRRPSTPQLVLAVVGLVLLAGLASYFLISNARVADKQQQVDELRGQLAGLEQPQEKPVPQATDQALVQERDGRTSALGVALGRRVAWDRLMRDVSLVLPADVWLTSLAATSATPTDATSAGGPPPDPTAAPSASSVQIAGYSKKQASVAQLLSRLAVLPEIASVKLVNATSTEVGDETVVQFTITATLKATTPGPTT